MPRQNPNLLSSAANLRGAAAAIRAAVGSGSFEDLKSALTAAAGAFEQAEGAFSSLEQRLRDLGEANVNDPRRPAGVLVSGDRIRGGVQVQGGLRSVMGQGMDLTFETAVSRVQSYDHGADGYLELDIDGLGVTINAHGGTITLTGTISLSAPLTVPMGGTGTATGSITGTGDLTFTAGGSNKTVTLVSSGTGRVAAKPGTDSATAFEVQTAAGVAVVDADTTNQALNVISSGTSATRGLAASQYNTGIEAARQILRKARGTAASPATVATSDNVGQLLFYAFGTTMAFRAGLSSMVSGAVATDSVPTDLIFFAGDGATTAERMRIATDGQVTIPGSLATTSNSVACTNGANANLALPAATYVRTTGPTGAYTISGFVAGSDGQHLELRNGVGFTMTLQDQNAGSTAANRIFTTSGADLVVPTFGFVSLIYDATLALWVVRSHT